MCKGAVFKSNTFQAVRLPKGMDFPDSVKQVDIIPIGNGRLIVPAGEGWDSWFDGSMVGGFIARLEVMNFDHKL